jgi:hypothetical protein
VCSHVKRIICSNQIVVGKVIHSLIVVEKDTKHYIHTLFNVLPFASLLSNEWWFLCWTWKSLIIIVRVRIRIPSNRSIHTCIILPLLIHSFIHSSVILYHDFEILFDLWSLLVVENFRSINYNIIIMMI